MSAIKGTSENDYLRGGKGSDTISGLAGDDTIRGGKGNDVIISGGGEDTLYGGNGKDTFYFSQIGPNGTYDTIKDFDPREDTIVWQFSNNPPIISEIFDYDILEGRNPDGSYARVAVLEDQSGVFDADNLIIG
jgi:Ca2+-binding RTX toxin-like protein